ncbi:hypothetical protein N9O46_00175 [Candidatus Pelagibacter ubique]|nr:hypothetical protein [Candidatus Pelagibacter ubique]
MICPQCNKKFIRSHNAQKYCSKICFIVNEKAYQKKYFEGYKQTEKGKKIVKIAQKKYDKSDKAKVLKKKRQNQQRYKDKQEEWRKSDTGKTWMAEYQKSEVGRKAHNRWRVSSKGKNYRRDYERARKKTDPVFKLAANMRVRLNGFLKTKNIRKNNKTFVIVGCSPEFLKKHLEKQFHRNPDTHQPMNWKNHTYYGWHVDHKIPLDKAKTPEDVEKLMHYTNLQPMWATENLKKGNKIN